MASYDHFSADNVALAGARDIGVFRDGKKIGRIPLGSLRPPNSERRLYSFGVISDTHINQENKPNANSNVEKAATFFSEEKDVGFVCICGDLVSSGDDEAAWISCEAYANRIGKPAHKISGNHEPWTNNASKELMKHHTGNQNVWFTKEYGEDVFLFLGVEKYIERNSRYYQNYSMATIRSIQRFLDENRNKRCFIFQHVPLLEGFEDYDIFGNYTEGFLPLSIYTHYKNITVFHGHTHRPFSDHNGNKSANINRKMGFRSVHIPALCDHCEGYVVDVYPDGIHLRGLNFETGYIPIASYFIDTQLESVSEYKYEEGD